jgi:membrane protease YdiL (CAAX protease family)
VRQQDVLARWQEARRRLEGWLPMPITHVVGEEQAESTDVVARRRKVVAATSAAGATLLGVSLSTKPNSAPFYALTLSTAATWSIGGLASGPLHLGWLEDRDHDLRRPWITPIATGVGAFGVFYAGALITRQIPFLEKAISAILQFAEEGNMPMVLITTYANGVGEEIFFRGALYSALPHHEAAVASTGIYALATATTRNPSLVLAALVMGPLFALQRRASGGLQAPLLTHLTWSTLMVRYLPPLFRRAQQGRPGTGSREARS